MRSCMRVNCRFPAREITIAKRSNAANRKVLQVPSCDFRRSTGLTARKIYSTRVEKGQERWIQALSPVSGPQRLATAGWTVAPQRSLMKQPAGLLVFAFLMSACSPGTTFQLLAPTPLPSDEDCSNYAERALDLWRMDALFVSGTESSATMISLTHSR